MSKPLVLDREERLDPRRGHPRLWMSKVLWSGTRGKTRPEAWAPTPLDEQSPLVLDKGERLDPRRGHPRLWMSKALWDIKDAFASPCGACRQFIVEFGVNIDLYAVKSDMAVRKTTSGEMLPFSFTPASLDAERVK
ncbi:hypothetical protein ScPMuIL_009306 [Solemya velum]